MGADTQINGKSDPSPRRSHVLKRLRRARRLIEEDYDAPLSLSDLAAAAFMSEAHFVRQFGRVYGITPCRYLTERRLLAARDLLERTDLPVIEIVPTAGFGNRCAFSRLFKRRFGLSPRAWRAARRRCDRPARSGNSAIRGQLPTVLLLVALPLLAVAEGNDEAPPPTPCSSEAHRQFDFWIGTWEVSANGQPAGRNVIRPTHGGCVLEERWQSAAGSFSGSSLNIYDAASARWHQTWADRSGMLLQLDGHFDGTRMELAGERPAADGSGMVRHRIRWTPRQDGTVRQQWEASGDGETWQALFDGIYRRADEGPGQAPGAVGEAPKDG